MVSFDFDQAHDGTDGTCIGEHVENSGAWRYIDLSDR